MYIVYTPRASDSARGLSRSLEGARIRNWRFWDVPPDDVIINWGARGPFPPVRKIFNERPPINKYQELATLHQRGVPSIQLSQTRPAEGEWLGRSLFHREGLDFDNPYLRPSFWTKKENFTREFRFHVFNYGGEDQRILRFGEKLPKASGARHPWVRSWRNGWKLSYGPCTIPNGIRPVAKSAISALGLDFGAVDLGLTEEGRPLVIEVNCAPGLDVGGTTISKYVEAFRAAT